MSLEVSGEVARFFGIPVTQFAGDFGRRDDDGEASFIAGVVAENGLRQTVFPLSRDRAFTRARIAQQHDRRVVRDEHQGVFAFFALFGAETFPLGKLLIAFEQVIKLDATRNTFARILKLAFEFDECLEPNEDVVLTGEVVLDVLGPLLKAAAHQFLPRGTKRGGVDQLPRQNSPQTGEIGEKKLGLRLHELQEQRRVPGQLVTVPEAVDSRRLQRLRSHPQDRRHSGRRTLRGIIKPLEHLVTEQKNLLDVVACPALAMFGRSNVACGLADRPEQTKSAAQLDLLHRQSSRQLLGDAIQLLIARGRPGETAGQSEKTLKTDMLGPGEVVRQDFRRQRALKPDEIEHQRLAFAGEGVVDQAGPILSDENVARIQIAMRPTGDTTGTLLIQHVPQKRERIGGHF